MSTFGKRFCGSIPGLSSDLAENHDAYRQRKPARLAFLRGDGMELAVDVGLLRGLRSFATSLGLRRLVPVQGGEPGSSSGALVMRCSRCGGSGVPREMLANIDEKPYSTYEHERCPE